MEGKTCAIYIDGDNFMYKGIPELFNYTKKWNIKVLHKVVYGDFSESQMLNWKEVCLDYNLTSIHLWKKHSKNSVDMKMSCDIQELLYTRNYNIDIFILCTGDRDFVPIIEKIHTQEKMVIGMSTNFFGTSSIFKNECDQFYSLCVSNHENDSKIVDKRKLNKSYKEEDIKEEFHSINLDAFFNSDTRETGDYIQKLKNIIKNGKYVSVLKDIVKTPDEEQIVKKAIDDMNKKPELIHKLKKVSKDVKDYVKESIKMENKNKFQKKRDKKYVKIKENKKINMYVHKCKKEDKKNKKKNKQTYLFESDAIDEILNEIDFAYEVEEVKKDDDFLGTATFCSSGAKKVEKDYSYESIKNFIIEYLKKENKSIFVSQIKDVILKSYPKFNEKNYHCTGFSGFIKSLVPEVKTKSEGVGILHAYL
jgi:hypothetical protein